LFGFTFRYRLSGQPPTIKGFPLKNTGTLSRGDMLNLEDGEVDLGVTGDAALFGVALETLDGQASTTFIKVIVDADGVYGVEDHHARLKGATLDLNGLTAEQRVGPSFNADLVVDVDSSIGEETLVRVNRGGHHEKPSDAERVLGGELNAAIARAVVRYHALQLGRGPTKAQAFHHHNVIVVVLENVMTRAERNVVAAGDTDAVLQLRQACQEVMRPYLRSTIERMTGLKVRAFMSANHLDPDIAAELFILDRPVPRPPDQADPGGTATERG
jgi:uncharacterized protein YbcI